MQPLRKGHFSFEDIALDLGLSLQTVYRMKHSSEFPPIYKFGKHYRVRTEDYEEYKRQAKQDQTPDDGADK